MAALPFKAQQPLQCSAHLRVRRRGNVPCYPSLYGPIKAEPRGSCRFCGISAPLRSSAWSGCHRRSARDRSRSTARSRLNDHYVGGNRPKPTNHRNARPSLVSAFLAQHERAHAASLSNFARLPSTPPPALLAGLLGWTTQAYALTKRPAPLVTQNAPAHPAGVQGLSPRMPLKSAI